MATTTFEKTNRCGVLEKHTIKSYKIPFLNIQKETVMNGPRDKVTVKKEISLMDDRKEIVNSVIVVLTSTVGFCTICKGIGKIISAFKGTTK
jgi:hypothetical protein